MTELVERVIGYLPRDSDKLYDWNEEKIQEVLDEYEDSLARTVQRFWYERVAETFEYISVKEGGTERPLNQIHQNARYMLAYWTNKVDEEIGRKPISFGVIERPTGDC